ncbi:MAG: glycosyltransferase family 2 protein, partial [Nitrospira sp.]|nr:glycosyltransferase family 2 protein [Nitrospira sp.]
MSAHLTSRHGEGSVPPPPLTISVIIPTLNERTVLAQTLARTADLGFDEIIVVDGGSTDGTMAIAETCCRGLAGARVITAPRGRGRQMNEGARASRGEGLLFLHADTLLPPDAKRAILSALSDTSVAGGRFDVRFDSSSRWGRMIGFLMNLRSRLTGIATGDQAMFVRRRVFEDLNGFP